jgi:flagellar hook-length control protein FliK
MPPEQRPLDKIPESDKAVMDMREQISRQKNDSANADESGTVAGFQQTQQAQNNQQTAQVRQPQQAPAQPEQAEQIQTQVVKSLESGRTEFRMQLAPEELGKISVKLVMEGGRLAVEIVTAGAKTAELLTRQAEALGMALRQHTGMEVTTVNIVTEAENASGNMGNPFGASADANDGSSQQGNQNGHGRGSARDDRQGASETLETKEDAAPESLLDAAV